MSLHAAIMADIERDELVTELRDEIKRLRAILDGDADKQATLKLRLGLTPQQAWVLAALHDLRGGLLTLARAQEAMLSKWRDPDQPVGNILNVLVCRIRKLLPDKNMIRTVHGTGFTLSHAGVAHLDALCRSPESMCSGAAG